MAKKKEEIIPQFTPLARVLIIDSSHRSRTELSAKVKACDLFEHVMEAASLLDASRNITSLDFDTCILGPSLSDNLVSEFLANVKPKSKAVDCAFIVIVKPGKENEVSFPEAHQVFSLPPSVRLFLEGIVKAILLAGSASPWPGIKLSDDGCISLLENGIWKVLDEVSNIAMVDRDELSSDFILTGERDSIEKFCESIPKTPKDKIEKIIKTLLAGGGSSSGDPFIPFFLKAIKEWQYDIQYMSLKEASQGLKARLLSFSETELKEH
jgi:hypothetical protein